MFWQTLGRANAPEGHFAISSADNMNHIKSIAKKEFIIPLKSNRNVFLAPPAAKSGKPVKLTSLDFDTNALQTLWLEDVDFPLIVSRQIAQSCLEQLSPFQERKRQRGHFVSVQAGENSFSPK